MHNRQKIGVILGGLIGGLIASGEDPIDVFLCIHEISETLKNPMYQEHFIKTMQDSQNTAVVNLNELNERIKKQKKS